MADTPRLLQPVLATCSGNGCPTVFAPDDDGVLVVQGYAADDYLPEPPDGERRVAVPVRVLLDAARRLGQ